MFTRTLLATTACMAMGTIASAQTGNTPLFGSPYRPFNGQLVARVSVDNKAPTTLSRFNLRPDLDAAWRSAAPMIENEMRKRMNGLRLTKGVSVYEADPKVVTNLTMEAKPNHNSILIRLKAQGNRVYFKTTTPDVKLPIFGKVGLPKAADPKARIDFDLEAEIYLQVDVNGSATARMQSMQVTNVRSRGANVTGWLAHAIGDVVRFLGGPDMRGEIRKGVDRQVNSNLNQIASKLQKDFRTRLPKLPVKPSYLIFGMEREELTITFGASTRPNKGPIVK